MTARENLTILQASPLDLGGGAEKVALDLHLRYLELGLDAWLAVGCRTADEPNTLVIPNHEETSPWKRGLTARADRAGAGEGRGAGWAVDRALRTAADPLHMRRIQRGVEDFDFPGTARLLELPPRPPGVLHLHNLHGGYFDIRRLPTLAARVPTIITLHDAWLLTGHCVYPMECEGWRRGCHVCPYLDRPIPIRRDAAAQNARIKREALSGGVVHLATPSRWLLQIIEESGIAGLVAETRLIPNGVDTSVFHPGDQAAARRALGLPSDALVVLFAARSAKSSPFKGFDTLEAALPGISAGGRGRELLMLALGQDEPDATIAGVPLRSVPFVTDPGTVAEYYRAADIYVHPARAENLPLAILEAMGCGAPIVASDAGGIPEIVTDGETGLLFRSGDPDALSSAVTRLVNDLSLRRRLGASGAELVPHRYDLRDQVEAYLTWYDQITVARSS